MTPGGASELALDLPPGCVAIDGREECDRHYRHSLIDKWNSIEVQRVIMELIILHICTVTQTSHNDVLVILTRS